MVCNYKVGLIGLSQSGKTTFLAGLNRFFQTDKGNGYVYTMSGDNPESNAWLFKLDKLLASGILPEATQITSDLKFRIEQTGAPPGKVRTANNDFFIETTDRMGGDFAFTPEEKIDEALANHLLSCNSYFLLIDLTQDDVKRQIDSVVNVFYNLRDNYKVRLSGKRVSVCLTKADHLKIKKMLVNNFNLLPPINLKEIKGEVLFRSYNNDLINGFKHRLISFFGDENIAFFLISSIGFFDDTENKTNLIRMEKGELMLRNGMNFRPINLDSPLRWCINRMTKDELNREQCLPPNSLVYR